MVPHGRILLLLGALLVLVGLAPPASAAASAAASGSSNAVVRSVTTAAVTPPIQHVVWLWMENRSYNDVIGSAQAPYINSLATTYGNATNAWAITHPSAPNYVGSASGLPLSQLPANDCTTCTQPGPDIFTQVSSWRAYQESMTTPCRRTQDSGGLYVPRHNPALYFTDISAASCQANDVNYSVLASDLASHRLPAFSFITPNLNNDMHSGNIAAGDTWVKANLPTILNSSEFTSGSTVVFLAFDEGTGGGTLKGTDCTTSTSESCHIPLIVISPYSMGTSSSRKLTLYSTLKATEDLLGVAELGQATTAPDLLADFGLAGPLAPIASFTSSCAALSCTFDASASVAAAGISSVAWDFGDGATDSGTVVQHTFGSAGTYPVAVTVTDAQGQSTSTTQQVTVTPPSPAQLSVSCTLLHCTADASASTLPAPTSYHFDFGDGTTADAASPVVGHVYAAAGAYTVGVTVSNGVGDSASTSKTVTVQKATAAFTSSCTALSCSFDASASTAPGAMITGYDWDFGDGSVHGAGVVASHSYPATGSYLARLTITDSTGDQTVVEHSVSVSAAVTSIGFVGANAMSANAKTESVTIPASVHAGDALVLIANTASATAQTTPSGWQVVKTATAASMYSTVWQRIATAADPGSVVKVTFGSTLTKGSLQVLAYTGTSVTTPVTSAVSRSGTSSASSFASPSTSVTTAGSWVVSAWFARSTNATTWLTPAGLTVRSRTDGTGGGHIDAMVADPGAPAAVGTVPGITASTDQVSGNQIAWALVLQPHG